MRQQNSILHRIKLCDIEQHMKKKRSKYEGRLIKKITKWGVTRKEFSKVSGLSHNTITNIDQGHTLPHQSSIVKIKRGFDALEKRGFHA